MDPDFEKQWRKARALENAGDVPAAKEIYDALIAEDPERLYVRLRLSSIALAANEYRQARAHALACARQVRGQRWHDLAAVSRLLLTFDERELVKELVTGADWTHPDIVRSSASLSQYLWLSGDVEGALALIDCALRFIRPSALLMYGRAVALGYLGRMAEASVEFERSIALDPNGPHAHWSLANHQKSVPRGDRIPRIQAALRAHPEESSEQPFLHYALFKEHDDAGDYASAWHHLTLGCRIKRGQIRYEPTLEEQGFERLREMTVRSPAGSWKRGSGSGPSPIFIVGMPRSGTTLLERILGGSHQVSAAGELNDFQSALCIESNQFMGAFARPDVLARLEQVDLAEVGRLYTERTARHAMACRFFSDKNPANFIHAGFIARALPHARILCLRRNPMDACFSNLKNLFANDAYGYGYDLDELADYYVRFDRLSAHWRDVLGDQYLEVDYERLVQDPLASTRRVMDFCGLDFLAESIEITRNTAPVTTASSAQVREPINRRGIGAWRKYESKLEPLRLRLERALGRVAGEEQGTSSDAG